MPVAPRFRRILTSVRPGREAEDTRQPPGSGTVTKPLPTASEGHASRPHSTVRIHNAIFSGYASERSLLIGPPVATVGKCRFGPGLQRKSTARLLTMARCQTGPPTHIPEGS